MLGNHFSKESHCQNIICVHINFHLKVKVMGKIWMIFYFFLMIKGLSGFLGVL